MRKIVFGLIGFVMLAGVASANYVTNYGNAMISSDDTIMNTTIHIANQTYPVTFEAGAVASFTMYASGADIKLSKSSNITGTKITIPNGASLYDHFPMMLPKNRTYYISSTTVPCTLEVLYTYY
jgi:hypothetical protein